MSDRINVGLVGARRGPSFVDGFRAIDGVDVTAICDINADFLGAQAERFGIPNTFVEFEEMLQSDVDLVVVASPMQLHVPQSVEALAAGKHVMSEVTAAVSVEQCQELVAAVEKARPLGLKYMMSENFTYMKHNVLIKSMVNAGVFGDIYYAEGQYVDDCKELHYNADGSPTWRSRGTSASTDAPTARTAWGRRWNGSMSKWTRSFAWEPDATQRPSTRRKTARPCSARRLPEL